MNIVADNLNTVNTNLGPVRCNTYTANDLIAMRGQVPTSHFRGEHVLFTRAEVAEIRRVLAMKVPDVEIVVGCDYCNGRGNFAPRYGTRYADREDWLGDFEACGECDGAGYTTSFPRYYCARKPLFLIYRDGINSVVEMNGKVVVPNATYDFLGEYHQCDEDNEPYVLYDISCVNDADGGAA